MSSRFVSSGRIDTQTGDVVPSSGNFAPPPPALVSSPAASAAPTAAKTESRKHERSAEWAAVQSQVDARRQTPHPGSIGSSMVGDGAGTISTISTSEADTRSLYEVLQANKAAKQAAFEEANKIKNQFRPLDEDDVEFLDEVRARKRAEERRARREEEEGLERFRKARERVNAGGEGGDEDGGEDGDEDKKIDGSISVETRGAVAAAATGAAGDEVLAAGTVTFLRRKQAKKQKEADEGREKQRQETLLKGIKRKAPTTVTTVGSDSPAVPPGKKKKEEEKASEGTGGDVKKGQVTVEPSASSKGAAAAPSDRSDAKSKPKLGLVDYGSDDDDDDD